MESGTDNVERNSQGGTTQLKDMDGNVYDVDWTVAFCMLLYSDFDAGQAHNQMSVSPKVMQNVIRLCTDNLDYMYAIILREAAGDLETWLERSLERNFAEESASITDRCREFIRNLDDNEFCSLYKGAIEILKMDVLEFVFKERLAEMKTNTKFVFPKGNVTVKGDGRDRHYLHNAYSSDP